MKDPTTEQLVMAAEFAGYECSGYFPDESPVRYPSGWWITHPEQFVGNPLRTVRSSPESAWARFLVEWCPHESFDQMQEVQAAMGTNFDADQKREYCRAVKEAVGHRSNEVVLSYPDFEYLNAPAATRFAAFLEVV